jgi:Ca2+-binding RTX toxin-like protein
MISRIHRTDLGVLRRRDFGRWLQRSHCERLEPRRLLASVSVQSGVLIVNGDNASETIMITPIAGGTVDVDINGNKTFIGNFNSLVVNANGGNDKVLLDPNFNWNSILRGGAGNDSLVGAAAFDVLDGGSGADTLKGGAANDTADYSSRTAPLTIGLGTLNDDGEAGEKDNVGLDIETVLGGSGSDNIRGSAANNLLVGGAGPDRLDGGPGNDTAQNDGTDTLISIENTGGGGGPKTAVITGRTLVVSGSAGNDFISLQPDSDPGQGGIAIAVSFDTGTFTFNFADFDRIEVNALGGNDQVILQYIDDGPDRFFITQPATINGGDGNDVITLVGHDATVAGGNGNDQINIEKNITGAWSFVGGAGVDFINDDTFDGTTIDLRTMPTVENAAIYRGVLYGNELNNNLSVQTSGELRGFGGDDQLFSTGQGFGGSALDGGDGNDTLQGGGGDDYLAGGAGNDDITGLDNNDTLDGGTGNDRLFVLIGGEGNCVLYGGDGNDVLSGGNQADSLDGAAGDDILNGRGGGDLMQGGPGNDTVTYASRTAAVTVGVGTLADDGEAGEKDNVYLDIETVIGGSGNDTIRGGAANNLLVGNGGNDSLFGNFGNDTLQGGIGNDSLDGGPDADTLDGGDGTDSGKQSAADLLISIETPT